MSQPDIIDADHAMRRQLPVDFESASWIAMAPALRKRGAPHFRSRFTVAAQPKRATLSICGLGYHEAYVGGTRVGDHVLDPAQTDYEKRCFFVRHDVTGLVAVGTNVLGIVLGNGFYNQDRVWNNGQGLSYGEPCLIAELSVAYPNDIRETVVSSDSEFRCATGPIVDNNVYAGEQYDSRRELDGWLDSAYDDSSWHTPLLVAGPGRRLEEQPVPPMRRVETLDPFAMWPLPDGTGRDTVADPPREHSRPSTDGVGRTATGVIVDFGRNFSGWAQIRMAAPSGTELRLRFAESLYPDGSVDTSSTGVFATGVEQIDRYVFAGRGIEEWEPRFTYHGFRYVEVVAFAPDGRSIELPNAEVRADDIHERISKETTKDTLNRGAGGRTDWIRAVVVHTDLEPAGSFACSSKRLSTLHEMALRTHRSNVHGIPEDCPARERCGWLGDANMVCEMSLYNYRSAAFWKKYLDDIETTRWDNRGLPFDIAPGKRRGGTARPDWMAAFVLIPWYLYLYTGDIEVARDHWEGMMRVLHYFKSLATHPSRSDDRAREWILTGGYGDWFDPGEGPEPSHTPEALTTTAWFYESARATAVLAQRLGHTTEAEELTRWRLQIAEAFRAQFYDTNRHSFGSQTADAMALRFGLAPHGSEREVAQSLAQSVTRSGPPRWTLGIFGVRYVFEVLSRYGYGSVALALMEKDTYPGFGDLISRGATTLWEYWGEKEIDERRGPRSLNHPMMAGFDNWFYTTLAGIRPDEEDPGFHTVVLQPLPIAEIDWVSAHHDSPHGRIESSWRRDADWIEWKVTLPAGTTGRIATSTAGAPARAADVPDVGALARAADVPEVGALEIGHGEHRFRFAARR
jgi:alpha-L-rhamnosidase